MPPGCGSRLAPRPFHSTILSGSVKNSNTVSGRAAILTSRSTTVATSGWSTATSPPSLLVLRGDLQALEPVAPERFQERPQVFEAFASDAVETLGALAPLAHEPRTLQDREVFGHRRPRDRELGGDLPCRALSVGHELEDAAAVRLRDCAKGVFHARIVSKYLRKTQLTYCAAASIGPDTRKEETWPSSATRRASFSKTPTSSSWR